MSCIYHQSGSLGIVYTSEGLTVHAIGHVSLAVQLFKPFSDVLAAAVPISGYHELISGLFPLGDVNCEVYPELISRASV